MPTAWPMIYAASLVSDAVSRGPTTAPIEPPRIHSIYRSVVNITTADGLLALASPEVGGLPNGILVDLGPDWRVLGLRPGMVVDRTWAHVRLPEVGIDIRLDSAPSWSPRFHWQDDRSGPRTGRRRWPGRSA